MKKVQNGFTTVEVLLTLVVVTLIVGVGFYIYNTQKKDEPTPVSKTNQTNKNSTTTEKPTAKPKQTYSLEQLPITFEYPKDWTAGEPSFGGGSNVMLSLTAPNTTKGTQESGNEFVKTGAEIVVIKHAAVESSNIAEFKASGTPQSKGTNKQAITIAGKEALEFDLSYEGPETHNVYFFDGNGWYYWIYMEKSVYGQGQYAQVFKDLVSSIKLK